MTAGEYIALAALVLSVGHFVYQQGRNRQVQAQTKKDVDGIGKRENEDIARQERRWLFAIADDVQAAESTEQRTRLAQRIRQDAFRK